MNERYPNIQTSRQSSRRSVATARKTSRPGSADPQHSFASRAGSRKPSTEKLPHTSVKARDRAFSTESIAEHDVVSLIQSTLASQHVKELALTSNSVENLGSGRQSAASIQAPASKAKKVVNRPKSAYELRVNYRNAASDRAKPLEVRRKAIESSLLEDNTIRNISAGPYASRRLDSPNQENTRPLESPLPAVSSSEWLAAGTNKRKEVRKASSMHPLARPISRSSPNCPPQRSPGQRMVTNWLDGRRSQENTPAFV
ncbi:hypothetical protein PRZ48_005963 [Zasmidium cellare]|uniref:Uncharacterized protein n=1 Tax=Zasmidium cellare TaxID=395010 RepID=A0ABR0ENZ4_ZASCE|nr:hypothetical protein PRZ48_005963 [Zasmidium cellare]